MNVPVPGPGAIAARRPIPQLSPDQRHPLERLGHVQRAHPRRQTPLHPRPAVRRQLDLVAFDRRCLRSRHDLERNEYSAKCLRPRAGKSQLEFRSPPTSGRELHLSIPVCQKARRLDPRSARRLASRWQFHRPIRRALHREHLQRPGQHRLRSRPAPQQLGQSQQRPQEPARVVRYLSLLAARALYLRHRASQRRHRTRPPANSTSRCKKTSASAKLPSSSSAPKPTTFSITRTSTFPIAPPSPRTSAASLARKIRVNCNSHSSCYSRPDWPSSCSLIRTHE